MKSFLSPTLVQSFLWVFLALPLASFLLISLWSYLSSLKNFSGLQRFKKLPMTISAVSAFLVAAIAILLPQFNTAAQSFGLHWVKFGSFSVDFNFLYTPLSSMMCFVIGVVALAVNLFSTRYMRDDDAQPRYYAGLSLFVFAMLGLTLSGNIVMFFAFWELVGFGSYLLIGHNSTIEAGKAANKAFMVNRLADVCFLLGIVIVASYCGTVNIDELLFRYALIPQWLQVVVASLITMGVIAKSAQLPLHLWLPDAMEGPTPVSALIHAATMVAAGVYLLCRLNFIFAPVLPLLMVLGVLTALCAAIWAFGQSDIKKVLAYSTVSQLGFMVAAVGLGAPIVAFFHLTTHAFFKALLFLGAGAVIDACHHKQQITEMGGLWKKLPLTTALFLVGTLALAGFPFTAGFFSKDAILTVAREHNVIVFGFLMLSSLFTALYMGRLFGLVFLGAPRSEAAEHPHGGGTSYAAPLILLSLGAIAGGAIHFYPSFAAKLFRHLPHEGFDLPLFVWSIFVAVLGALVAFLCARAGADVIPTWSRIFSDTWKFFDQVWNSLGKIIGERFAGLSKFFDEEVIGQTVIKGGGQTIGGLGQLTSFTYKSLLTYIIYFLLLGVLLFLLFVHA